MESICSTHAKIANFFIHRAIGGNKKLCAVPEFSTKSISAIGCKKRMAKIESLPVIMLKAGF